MVYLSPDLDSSVMWTDVAPWLHRLSTLASKPVSILEGSSEMWGTYCDLPALLDLMYKHGRCRPRTQCNPVARGTHG